MSIKYKIPMLLTTICAAIIVALLLFSELFIVPYIKNDIAVKQKDTGNLINDIGNELNGKTVEDGLIWLENFTADNPQIFFVIQDSVTNEQIIIPSGESEVSSATSAISVSMSGKTYIVFLKNNTEITELLENVEYRIIFLTLIMFLAAFAVTCVIIHIRYVTPILRLKEEVEHYQTQSLMIQPSKRSDELGKLENSFYKMKKELAEEKAKQNRIIASISHDIKTPLTSLMGFSERLIKKDLDKEKQTAYLKNIYTQAKNIESIVGEFDEYLSFSLDAELRFQDVEVSFFCKMLEDEYQEIMSDKGVRFAVVNHCGPVSAVYIDIAKMRRVFANIIGNALHHNQTERLSISVIAVEEEAAISFTINDNGKGVSDVDMEHIFEPFYTADKSRKISGLGLSICHQIMNTHSGGINAQNTDQGFSVKLQLPKSKG